MYFVGNKFHSEIDISVSRLNLGLILGVSKQNFSSFGNKEKKLLKKSNFIHNSFETGIVTLVIIALKKKRS